MSTEQCFSGVWVDRKIWLSKSLTPIEKLLIVEVDSLSASENGCPAPAGYFADFLMLSISKVRSIFSSLIKRGLIVKNVVKGVTYRSINHEALNTEINKIYVN